MSIDRVNITESRFNFFVKIAEMDKEYLTPKITLADMLWQINIYKLTTEVDEDEVNVFLVCSSSSGVFNWICEAKATIEFRAVGPDQETYNKTFPKTAFTANSPTVGFSIKFDDFKRYEHNGIVCVDVQLSANPPKRHTGSGIELMASKFRFTVENVSQGTRKLSPEVTVQGANWYVVSNKIDRNFGVFLKMKKNPFNENWFWEVNCTFKLIPFNAVTPTISKKISYTFGHNAEGWGFAKFIAWNDFMDPAKMYVQDDKATFEIDLDVNNPKPLWDIDQNVTKRNWLLLECSVCLQGIVDRQPVVTKCGHLFCGDCIKQSIEERKKCPMCNANADLAGLRTIYISK